MAKRTDAPTQWDTNRIAQLKSGQIKGAFAGPNSTFPIASPEDVSMAWRLSEKVEYREDLRKNIVSIASKHGWLGGLPQDALIGLKKDRMDGPKCSPGNKVCGERCIPKGHTCHVKGRSGSEGALASISGSAAGVARAASLGLLPLPIGAVARGVALGTAGLSSLTRPTTSRRTKGDSLGFSPRMDYTPPAPAPLPSGVASKDIWGRIECKAGNKKCGLRCIPNEHHCKMEDVKKLRLGALAVSVPSAAVAIANYHGLLPDEAAAVARYARVAAPALITASNIMERQHHLEGGSKEERSAARVAGLKAGLSGLGLTMAGGYAVLGPEEYRNQLQKVASGIDRVIYEKKHGAGSYEEFLQRQKEMQEFIQEQMMKQQMRRLKELKATRDSARGDRDYDPKQEEVEYLPKGIAKAAGLPTDRQYRFRKSCTPGNKPCGFRCIPNEQICHTRNISRLGTAATLLAAPAAAVSAAGDFGLLPPGIGEIAHNVALGAGATGVAAGLKTARKYAEQFEESERKPPTNERYTESTVNFLRMRKNLQKATAAGAAGTLAIKSAEIARMFTGDSQDAYINAYADARATLDARLQCGPGSKQCGDRCIPQEYRCRMEEGQKLSNLGMGLGAVGTLAEIRGSALKDLNKIGLGGGDYKTWAGVGRILRVAGATAALQGDLTQASELMKEGKGVSAGLKALTAGLNAAEGARQVGRFGTEVTGITQGLSQGFQGAVRAPFELGKKAGKTGRALKQNAEQVGGGIAQGLMGEIPAEVKPLKRKEWWRQAQGTYTAPKKERG